MKVLVTGGRGYRDVGCVNRYLTQLNPSMIIEGGCRRDGKQSADYLAKCWGMEHGVHVATVEALWGTHDRAAGPIRNQAMLQLMPHVVLAFPGGDGTADMVKRAKEAGIRVIEVGK